MHPSHIRVKDVRQSNIALCIPNAQRTVALYLPKNFRYFSPLEFPTKPFLVILKLNRKSMLKQSMKHNKHKVIPLKTEKLKISGKF